MKPAERYGRLLRLITEAVEQLHGMGRVRLRVDEVERVVSYAREDGVIVTNAVKINQYVAEGR